MHRSLSAPLVATALACCVAPSSARAQADRPREFPADWFWHASDAQWARHAELIGAPRPGFTLHDWRNGALDLDRDLQGKITVVVFWSTWCVACQRRVPADNALARKYPRDKVVMFGICGRGEKRMDEVGAAWGIEYPIASDVDRATTEAWRVMWWPTYAVLDCHGVPRAIGLKPDHVEAVIDRLLAGETPPAAAEATAHAGAGTAEFVPAADATPPDWLEDNARRSQVTDRPAPPLSLGDWQNGAPLSLPQLAGKVVLLSFWAVPCASSLRAMPAIDRLARRYRDAGLAVIGICHRRGGEQMDAIVRREGLRYPVALDVDGKTVEAYGANSYPDYYLIDRHGTLRIADCANDHVEAAVEMLLNEK